MNALQQKQFCVLLLKNQRVLYLTGSECNMCKAFLHGKKSKTDNLKITTTFATYLINNFQDLLRRKFPDEYSALFN